MGVVAPHRRKGIGEATLVAALDAARAAGIERVRLEVLEQNEPARRLYERLASSASATSKSGLRRAAPASPTRSTPRRRTRGCARTGRSPSRGNATTRRSSDSARRGA